MKFFNIICVILWLLLFSFTIGIFFVSNTENTRISGTYSGNYYNELDRNVEKYNKNNKYKISLAKGYAQINCDKENDIIHSIYKQADQNMYKDKERCHKDLANEEIINKNYTEKK